MSEITCQLLADELAALRVDIQNLESAGYFQRTLNYINELVGNDPDKDLAREALRAALENADSIRQLEQKKQPLQVKITDDKITIQKDGESAIVNLGFKRQLDEIKNKHKAEIDNLKSQLNQLQQKQPQVALPSLSGLATKQELNNLRNQVNQAQQVTYSNNSWLDRTRQKLDDLIGIDDDGKPNQSPDTLELEFRIAKEILARQQEDSKLWKELNQQRKLLEDYKKQIADQNTKIEQFNSKISEQNTKILANAKAIAQTKLDLEFFKKRFELFKKGLPAIVKTIFWSIIASVAFNTALSAILAGLGFAANPDIGNLKKQIDQNWKQALRATEIAVKNKEDIDTAEKTIAVWVQNLGQETLDLNKQTATNSEELVLQKNRVFKIEKQLKLIDIPTLQKLGVEIPKILGQLALLAVTVKGLQTVTKPIIQRFGDNKLVQNTTNNFYYDQRRTNNTYVTNNQGQDLSWLRQKVNAIDNNVKANLALNGLMNNKLGAQLKDGLAGWMTRFSKWDIFNRLMGIMTLAATIHNAQMLSNNLAMTLIQSIQNIVNFFELKDSEGKGYDVNELIKTSIANFLKNLLGESAYNNLNTTWKTSNKIYQSAGNLLNSMLSFGDIVTQGLQLVTGQTSKIGNALRIWGTVGEKAFGWMNPNPNFNNPILMKLNNLNETASIVEEVSQQPQNVKDAKTEVETNAATLRKDVEQGVNHIKGIEWGEAAEIKANQDASKANSPGQDLTEEDLEADTDD